EPAVVQVVGRELSAVVVQVLHARGVGQLAGPHPDILGQAVALAKVAGGAGGDDVVPGGLPAFRPGNEMVEREVFAGAAILAGETIAQENVEPGEGGLS